MENSKKLEELKEETKDFLKKVFSLKDNLKFNNKTYTIPEDLIEQSLKFFSKK